MQIATVLCFCLWLGVGFAAAIDTDESTNTNHCEPDWLNANGKCYRLLQNNAKGRAFTWTEASSQCKALGADLISADDCLPLSDCAVSDRGVLCAKPFSNCAIGWYENRRNCYQLNAIQASWDEAKTACNQMGADLIQITEAEIQEFVNGYLAAFRRQNIPYIWIGIYQMDHSKPLMWTSGPEVSKTYNNWYPGEPKLSSSQRNAGRVMVMMEKGNWQIGVPTDTGGYICQLPLGVSPIVPTLDYKFSCPESWQLFRGSCYQFVRVDATWHDARAACRSVSPVTDLVDIRDAAEQEFVQRNLNLRDIWTGLHSKPDKWGEWYWNDDQMTATYFNWYDGEPNNHEGIEFCVEAYALYEAKWNDQSCSNLASYACKRPADVNGSPPSLRPTNPTPKWDPICGVGWVRDTFTDLCYMVNLEPMNWHDARVYCQSQRGDLASITSLSEKTFVTGRIQAAVDNGANALGYWIGFNDLGEEGRWVWSDASPVAFINWDYGEPNNYEDNEDCGLVFPTTFFWNDETCGLQFASVCKKSGSTSTTVKPPPTTIYVPGGQVRGCPKEYSGYNNMCYRLYLQYSDWNDARHVCKNDGGDLVSIEDKQEHEFVYELVQRRGEHDIWIGMYDTTSALRTMYFQWTDGAPVTFTNWNVGEPNDWQDNENCVQQFSVKKKGEWNDESCETSLPFVCKRREIALITTLPTTRPMGCPDGYDDAYNGNCYKYVLGGNEVTRNGANLQCRAISGALVSILSSEEQGHLNLKMYGLNANQPFWIGLGRIGGGMAWANGPTLGATSYTNWATDANTKESYAFMYSSGRALGTWSMESTIYKLPNYVCKRQQDGPTTPSPPPTTYNPRFCAAGWEEADNTCYRSFATTITNRLLHWDEARIYCRHLGGDLASIHSLNATEVLRSVVETSGTPYWIGLNSRDTDKSHMWTDGSSPNYFNWKTNEPNNFNKRLNCVLLDPVDMQWYVTSCSSTANYICETPKGIDPGNVTTMEPTTRPDDPDCGTTGWKYFKGSCYYVRIVSNNWFAARKYCKDRSADLASIIDDDENEFVHRQVAKVSRVSSYWIGLNELGQTDGYRWSDGNPVGYLNWQEHEPNNAGGAEHCVTMYGVNGMWNDDQCGTSMPSVCKRNNETAITDPPQTPMPGECPKDYHTVGDKCFRLFGKSTNKVTWQEAFDLCAIWGGVNKTYLASITSEYEQAALIALSVDAEEAMWIGLHTRLTTPRRYVWIDNSQFTYANWDHGEPNGNINNQENCVEFYSQTTQKYRAGKWNDVHCEQKRGYVCMTHRQPNIRTTWPGPQPTKVLCSGDWVQYGSACFRFYDQPARWPDAQQQCQSQGGNLASVHDVWEQNYLHWLTRDKPLDATWIGLSDQQTEGNFVWSDGWPVLYAYWGTDQPNEHTGSGCVRMDRNGKWFNGPCSATMPYLCRISHGPAPTTPLTVPGRCPNEEFVQYGQHCYYISESRIASNRRDFATAQLECKLKGGDLASITSPGEQDFLAHTITARIQDGRLYSNYWIGMTRQLEDGFQWMDGSAVSYVHWAPGEPSDKDGSNGKNCVEMYQSSYQWSDISCGTTNAYVCKVAKRPFTAGTKETGSTGATSTRATSTSRMTLPPGQSSTTATTTSEASRTTRSQTGRLLTDLRNDLLVGGLIVGILLLLLALILGVFFYKRQQNGPGKSSPDGGFTNANWSRDSEAVTLASGGSANPGLTNPNFVEASPPVDEAESEAIN